ncbi:MAG: amidohydrolase family protein [Thermoanaerobacterales bacterium]|nr:amidohydrolase family protein [Bacillota bacterium]MDI6907156.1 amidohydrolase family protein [Thermoanaerobacterales bacterium]
MIIDFRVRPSTPELVSVAENRVFKGMMQWLDFRTETEDLDTLAVALREEGITKAVVQGRDLETTYGWKVTNDHIAEIVNKHPDMFIGFAGADPWKGMAAVREIQRAVTELGLAGVSVDPYMHQMYCNDARYYPIYAKCTELGVPVEITAGPGAFVPGAVIDHVAPRYVDFVARDFPELKIIVSHGGYPWVAEMITVALRNRNVYFEISAYETMPGSDLYVKAANDGLIDKKLLYASAHPFVNFRKCLRTWDNLPFKDEVRRRVMYENAAQLLGLDLAT